MHSVYILLVFCLPKIHDCFAKSEGAAVVFALVVWMVREIDYSEQKLRTIT